MSKRVQLLLILLLIGIFSAVCHGQTYFIYNIGALTSCLLALYVANFNFLSFNSILILGHVVQYPLASFLVDSLEAKTDAMFESELELAPPAMICLIIAMVGLSAGILIYRSFLKAGKDAMHLSSTKRVSSYVIFFLLCCYILYIVIAIYTNTYYHKVAGDYDVSFATNYGAIGYLLYFGYVGLGLQCYNFFLFKERRDGIVLLLYASIVVLLMLPSGSRRFIILPLILVLLLYVNTIKVNFGKILLISSSAIVLMVSLPILEYLRNEVSSQGSVLDRLSDVLALAEFLKDTDLFKTLALLGRRLSDYTSVGYIHEYLKTPEGKYLGFLDLFAAPLYIVPTVLRPETNLNYNYDAIIMQQIGFRTDIGGSSPTMLIGDLLIRGGKTAIFFGFLFFGFFLEYISEKLSPLRSMKGMIIWIMMFDTITSLHTMTILKFFVLFTKQFFLFLLFAEILNYINMKMIKSEI